MTLRVVLSLAVSIVVVAVAAWLLVIQQPGGASISGGPLRQPSNHAYYIHDPVGTVFADGFETLRIPGDEPVTITEVSVVGGSPALQFLGAKIAGPSRKWGFEQRIYSYPEVPKRFGPLVAATGAVLQPESQIKSDIPSYELILGFRVVQDTFAIRSRIDIHYQVADHTYLRSLPARLVYCGTSMSTKVCLAKFKDLYPHD